MNTRHVMTMLDCLRMQKHLYGWNGHINSYDDNMLTDEQALVVFEDVRQRTVCFVVDNVAESLLAGRKPGEPAVVKPRDLPCVRPPFPITWFEFGDTVYTPSKKLKKARIAALINHEQKPFTEFEEHYRLSNSKRDNIDQVMANMREELSDAKGIVHSLEVATFLQLDLPDGPVVGPIGITWMALKKDGTIYGISPADFVCPPNHRDFVTRSVAVALQSLAFLHCRNVSLVEKEPPTTIAERHRRKHPPMVKYKMLSIKPMGKRFSQSAAPGAPGSAETPYHICRGHFKTFDEKPLLGRTRGTFWWGHFARGNKKHGEVIKDYDVRPGEEVSRPGDGHHDGQPSQGKTQTGSVPS